MRIFALINDRKKDGYVRHFSEDLPQFFQEQNKLGFGVYRTVNDFFATDEQIKNSGGATMRQGQFLQKINAAFADLDIAKAGDGMSREEKERKKEQLMFDLYGFCMPSRVIGTSNGIQPVWELVNSDISPEYQSRYVSLLNAIINWSKTKGAKGDQVKDTARVLREPGYFHMKEEPFLCTTLVDDDFGYTLEQLEEKFSEFIEKTKPTIQHEFDGPLDDLSVAIDSLDIQEITKRAFASIGRAADFDKTGRLILDGRLTGTFQGRKDGRGFLASSSHEPFKGNRITLVADIKQITNKEARGWLIDEFGLRPLVAKRKALDVLRKTETKKKNDFKRYTWGTKELDESFAPIKSDTYAIIGAGYGTGKTTFCFNMALKNAELGHRVLYLSLEMDNEEIYDYFARKFAGWTIPEEIYSAVPERKRELYDSRKRELSQMKNLTLRGVRSGGDITWATLEGLMEGEWDMVFIDNFNQVIPESGMGQYEHENFLSKRLLAYSSSHQVPLIVVHHYSQGGAKENKKTGYSLAGSARIKNDASRLVLLDRKRPTLDDDSDAIPLTEKEKAKLRVILDKGRGYVDGVIKIIYFYRGTFLDSYPEPPSSWQDNF